MARRFGREGRAAASPNSTSVVRMTSFSMILSASSLP